MTNVDETSMIDFAEKISTMYDFYTDLERQFLELSFIIPLDNPDRTYSPRLYDILQSACGQVENMSRILCDKLNLKYSKKNKKFPTYYGLLNQKGMLESQIVYVVKTKQVIKPFVITSGKTPDWWRGYNDTKHELPEGILQGNIKNTIHALSALCALHRISYSAYPQLPILNGKNWYQQFPIERMDPITLKHTLKEQVPVLSPNMMFYCLTNFGGMYE